MRKSFNEVYIENLCLDEYINILKYVEKFKPQKILDMGCGFGVFLSLLREKGFNAIGIDLDKDHVKICISKGLNAKNGDAQKIPLTSGSFDMVILLQVLEHCKDHNKVFKEVYRVLKKKGKFICTVPSGMGEGAWSDPTHLRGYSKRGLRQLAVDNDFKVLELYATSSIGENKLKFLTPLLRKIANSRLFPYLQGSIYLICEK